ncbi:MAG: hypothetical protein ACTHKE_09250 [Sphingomicrobium sp.]
MFARFFVSAAVASLLTAPALATDISTNSPGLAAQSNAQQATQNLPSEIRSKLEQDGFTDVNVVPGSFLVSAKDKSGDPVTMVIGPNSMMMLTQVPKSTGSTTGSGTSSGSSSTADKK